MEYSKTSGERVKRISQTSEGRTYLSIWGSSGVGVSDVSSLECENERVRNFAVGDTHLFVISQKGSLFGVGDNSNGQLQPGGPGRFLSLTRLNLPSRLGVAELSCGADFTMALAGGELFSWGLNAVGQLGLGHTNQVASPELVSSLAPEGRLLGPGETVKVVACGAMHALALSSRGRVFSTGFGLTYALGHGERANSSEFREVFMGTKKPDGSLFFLEKVVCGVSHSVVLGEGRAWVWGKFGPDPTALARTPQPVKTDKPTTLAEVAAGIESTLFLNSTGEVLALGRFARQPGTEPIARLVDLPAKIRSLSHGAAHAVMCSQGCESVFGLGSNAANQLDPFSPKSTFLAPSELKWLYSVRRSTVFASGNATVCISLAPLLGKEETRQLKLKEADRLARELRAAEAEMLRVTELNASLMRQNATLAEAAADSGEPDAQLSDSRDLVAEINRLISQFKSGLKEEKKLKPDFEINFEEIELTREVARGGFGTVHLGKWREAIVAVKLMRKELLQEEYIKDFLCLLTRRVQCYGVFETPKRGVVLRRLCEVPQPRNRHGVLRKQVS